MMHCFRIPSARYRHLLVFLLSAILIGLFSLVHCQWEPLHRWNRAFGDTALVLLALALTLGPLAVLFPRVRGWVVWRRQVGIWAMVWALAHLAVILHAWVEWNLIRLFGFEYSPMFRRYIMHQHGFGLANAVGILALVFGLLLMLSSSDRAVRWLTPTVWQQLHRGAVVFWWLVVVHVGYFLFIHFLDVRRPMLEPNPLQWPFVILLVGVFLLRSAAFVRQWRSRATSGQ
ncbi:hypothetical protein E4656_19725 [Natronospirillum operosum]|uniref:Ferric oxidoreductase domain-containing protein n=1 Tax=Natronospirillum operosum TaxID=2759953 RepID=A0A4Z0WAF0_9GAMM|nr:ferric reductase-like transmembrane domain-containing protein [Natronospirillum operosum]TGG89969.1 hypothetical protein E4656_19725 [Natronospirillum operosum]